MLKFRKAKLLILFLLLFLFLGASFVLAQKPLEITYPEIPGVITPTTDKTALPDYIRYVFQFSLFLGTLIAFSSLIYGGVRYLTSAGSPSRIKDAKSQISAGILGLIILISAYLILNTINPQLVAWEVSLPGKAPTTLPAAGPCEPELTTLLEIPLGGLIENLWGGRTASPHRPADCYKFNDDGDRTTDEPLENQERLDCVQGLSKAIQVKAEKLKEPIEELQKLYDAQNCCQDLCKNVCDWAECSEICDLNEETENWENCPLGNLCCEGTQNKGCWENCGAYESCEGQGMVRQYYYQECPYSGCEYFQPCPGTECGYNENWERTNTICIKQDGEGRPVACNFERDPTKPYEDLLVRSLIDKNLLSEEEKENDPYKDLKDIKTALKELRLKLGLFPLTEELKKSENLANLLDSEETKNLIKEILIGEPADEEKLEEILKIKSVMKYLVESDLLSTDKNLAKIMMRNIDLLKNEVAINEIAWMGTQADSADEWIELYNNTEENINLAGWKLVVKDKFEINLSGAIPSQGFYLLENNENTVSDIEADLIYSGNLADSGEIIGLYDEFENLVEEIDCSSEWFAGNEDLKASMERINPKGCLNLENWATNLSVEVEEERKKDYINGKDRDRNPIYGTPKNPNSAGVSIISYPSFNSLVAELRDRLGNKESLREKLILVLRKEGNLERMMKSKEALKNILVGDDWRLKNLLIQGDVLRVLIEDEENLNLLLADEYAKEVIKNILKIEEDEEWIKLVEENLPEARTNLKLINEFQRDLLWVLDARDLMRGCEGDPISYDQLRTPELGPLKIEKAPEWKNIRAEVTIIDPGTGQSAESPDPTIFYCPKPLW